MTTITSEVTFTAVPVGGAGATGGRGWSSVTELKGTVRDVAPAGSLLDHFDPFGDDSARLRRTASGPAIQIEGQVDDQRLADQIVTLDRSTLALRIVPSSRGGSASCTTAPTLRLEARGEVAGRFGAVTDARFSAWRPGIQRC
jgi:hypothetical protein